MTLGDLYRYSKDEQIFKVFTESGLSTGSKEPIYKGKLTDCTTDLFDEIVDNFSAEDNEIIVIICI
nr:MAG TPA: hypothetical protein [Caudoviricetes sp.]